MSSYSVEVISGLKGKYPAAILLKTDTHHILCDAGGVLEEDADLWQVPERIDAVLLSHDHFDHIGNVKNLPKNVPIYCSAITASVLPVGFDVHIIPIKGHFYLGNTKVTTGSNGHAYGGMWFHFDCGEGVFYSGDVSLESLLYHFETPPCAELILVDASYGLYNDSQEILREKLLARVVDDKILLPVPPSGRAVEMALWLNEQGLASIALDAECYQFLEKMITYNDGSLHCGIEARLADLRSNLQKITINLGNYPSEFAEILLAGDPDGRKDVTGILRALPAFTHRVIFTGYCDALARKEIEQDEVEFFRWNVHPTKQSLQQIVEISGCKRLVPLFTKIDKRSDWERAFNVAIVLDSVIAHPNSVCEEMIDETRLLVKKASHEVC